MRIGKRQLLNLSLWGGPAVCALAWWLPAQLAADATSIGVTHEMRWVIGLTLWMALWWLSEAVPLPVTSLLPAALLPLVGVADITTALAPYADPLIFLFFGGFVISIAVQKWGLHRRFAFRLLHLTAGSPHRLVAGFMVATAFLSLWLSNTAAAILMLPVALSVADQEGASPNLRKCLLLGVAYSATIGGMGTLIGTPPNLFVASFLAKSYAHTIDFGRWLLVGLPMVLVMLPVTWWVLTHVRFPVATAAQVSLPEGEDYALAWSRLSTGARATLVVFLCAAVAWITRPWLVDLGFGNMRPFAALTDPGIALLAALALFTTPLGGGRRAAVLSWDDCTHLPWGTLLLFGGGLSLAAAITATGADRMVGAALARVPALPPWLVVAAIAATVMFVSEIASNIATTATMAPLLAAGATALGLTPTTAAVVTALAASSAYMMPVGTAPNALVYGTGHLSVRDMAVTGFVLNAVSIALIVVVGTWIVPSVSP